MYESTHDKWTSRWVIITTRQLLYILHRMQKIFFAYNITNYFILFVIVFLIINFQKRISYLIFVLYFRDIFGSNYKYFPNFPNCIYFLWNDYRIYPLTSQKTLHICSTQTLPPHLWHPPPSDFARLLSGNVIALNNNLLHIRFVSCPFFYIHSKAQK